MATDHEMRIYQLEMFEALHRIWKICHRPSTAHPKGGHAYTHFMADFDQIRAICKPFVDK